MSADKKSPQVPSGLFYMESHEWARLDGENEVTIGITAYAAEEMGDIVHIELPAAGAKLAHKEPFGVIDSVKAAFDLYSPVTGIVLAVNPQVLSDPSIVSKEPFAKGWMMRVKASAPAELDRLMNAARYSEYLQSGAGGH